MSWNNKGISENITILYALDFWFFLYSSSSLPLKSLSHLKFYPLLWTTENEAKEGHVEALLWTAVHCKPHGNNRWGWESSGWGSREGKALAKGNSWRQHMLGCEKGTEPGKWNYGHFPPLCHFLAVWLRVIHLTSLSLDFLIYKVIIVKATSQGYCEDLRKSVC